MVKVFMADYIEGAINKLTRKVKHGKLKIKKSKLKSSVSKKLQERIQHLLNDTVNKVKRKKINKKIRKDNNPALGAHNIIADVKRNLSNIVRQDLGLKNEQV